MSASQSSNLLLSVTLLFTFQMLSSTHAASITCNTPLGVQGDSWEVGLSSSIFLLRLQFHTVLALGNILGINTWLSNWNLFSLQLCFITKYTALRLEKKFHHIMSASQSSNLLLSVTLLFTFQMLSSIGATSISCKNNKEGSEKCK